MPLELSDDHVAAICRVLIDHEVRFVIIGGMAARLHNTGHATIDIDICPSLDDVNLSHLADALRELGARLRVEGDPDGVPFGPHPAMLHQVEMMTLITEHGPLDLCLAPAGSLRVGGTPARSTLAAPIMHGIQGIRRSGPRNRERACRPASVSERYPPTTVGPTPYPRSLSSRRLFRPPRVVPEADCWVQLPYTTAVVDSRARPDALS